ncbi:hypothetical protein GCM10010297_01460 [Streptomyces malachitofuscus]|nr:hypothetical protein GCM10010297_01460 [Streptomyces malachitofuscus]
MSRPESPGDHSTRGARRVDGEPEGDAVRSSSGVRDTDGDGVRLGISIRTGDRPSPSAPAGRTVQPAASAVSAARHATPVLPMPVLRTPAPRRLTGRSRISLEIYPGDDRRRTKGHGGG